MGLLKRMWYAPATAGMAFVAAATSLAMAWTVHDVTGSWLWAIVGGLVWSLLWLWWDVRHPQYWGRGKSSE
jgi:hypothetical protein